MADSKIEYHRQNIEGVLRALGKPLQVGHLPHEKLRTWLDRAGDGDEFRVGVADFWLDISQHEGRWRRRQPSPPSPFRRAGTKLVAPKRDVGAWGDAWLLREAAKVLKRSRTAGGKQMASALLATPGPYLTLRGGEEDEIIGHCAWLPESAEHHVAMAQMQDLDVQWIRPAEALMRRWRDPKDAQDWQEIVIGCHRMIEADIERAILLMSTVDPGHEAHPPQRRL